MEGPLVGHAVQQVGYLGLGSNVGEREVYLRRAVDALEAAGVSVAARASLYETSPQGEVLDQPDFLNSVIRIETDLQPLALLDLCKGVERELGRAASGLRHGPRVIDIDVLLLGETVLAHERLTLPHPEITSRHFVLAPLLELDPGLVLPDGVEVAQFSAAVATQPVRKLGAL